LFKFQIKSRIPAVLILFIFSFLVWVYAFRGFFSGKFLLCADASAYFEHFRFFLDNISRGVYPQWDPSRNWGMPIELFLRRIGSYNPLFLTILLLNKIGVSYIHSYFIFLAGYYFLGMTGFYLLSKRVLNDSRCAFLAYLLLMFSALGTRNFDSYSILTFVPMVWFYYFLVVFSQQPARASFLGITFTLMILVTTYIPFYFLTIFLFFIFWFVLIYPRDLQSILSRSRQFASNNKIFVCLCTFIFLLSLIPGLLFYMEGAKGELVFPGRHEDSVVKNTLEVTEQKSRDWSIIEELMFAGYYSDLHKYEFGIFYIPVFAFLLLFLGMIVPINKRLTLLLAWGAILFLIGSPNITPLYNFFYEHVFFFKYFRNLHYFLWLGLLPIFVVLLSEQFRWLLQDIARPLREKVWMILFVSLVHGGFYLFLYSRGNVLPSTYGVIFLSWIFFSCFVLGLIKNNSLIFYFLLLVLVAAQPMEVYHYLSQRTTLYNPEKAYRYMLPYIQLSLPTQADKERSLHKNKSSENASSQKILHRKPPNIYAGSRQLNFLIENIDYNAFLDYAAPQFLVYDRVEMVDEKDLDFKRIERTLSSFENIAFVRRENSFNQEEVPEAPRDFNSQAQIITRDSPELQVVEFGVNFVKLKVHFDTRKFLVYNDSFHSGWQAYIDGKKTDIWLANVAFKGIWLSSGEHSVYFRYGTRWSYCLNFFLMGIFVFVFGWLVFLWTKGRGIVR